MDTVTDCAEEGWVALNLTDSGFRDYLKIDCLLSEHFISSIYASPELYEEYWMEYTESLLEAWQADREKMSLLH